MEEADVAMTPNTPHDKANAEEWARRRKSNVQLGLILGGVAVALFIVALFKYRPL